MSPRSNSKAAFLIAAGFLLVAWTPMVQAQTSRHVPNKLRPTTSAGQRPSEGEVRRASYTASPRNAIGYATEREVPAAYIPKSERMRPIPQDEGGVSTTEVYEEVSEHYDVHLDHGCDSCGTYACAGGCLIPCPQVSLRNMEFFTGVDAFKGPQNLGRDGSFGFTAGFNAGFKLPCMPCDLFDGQFGVSSVNANFA
ncbi:MAG: DUF6666 family protein, partial [Planctomycetota bacterium]|nr:DUF6666 family protein [Planctomycetota bacterium]